MVTDPSSFDRKKATVGRGAYFGGIFAGLAVLAVGMGLVSSIEGLGWGTIPLEMGVVAVAMLVTTMIWKRSARRTTDQGASEDDARAELDSPIEPPDGNGQ